MAVRKTRAIRQALLSKGFSLREGGNHEKYFLRDQNGKVTAIFTLLSRGSRPREYDDRLLGRMARQLKLSKDQLLDLIDCPLHHAAYMDLLQQQDLL